MEYLSQSGIIDLEPYATALLLLYVLVIPAFFIVMTINRNRKAKVADFEGDSSLTVSDDKAVCSHISERYGLTGRQTEILGFLALGRDTNYIAGALFLSRNTVNSYRKNLYAALGIHSKQELIDMIEAERNREADELA